MSSLPSDNRDKFEWNTKYSDTAQKHIKIEAVYLIVSFCIAFAMVVANYKGFFTDLLCVPNSEVYLIQRIIYCLAAGYIGGITFSIKIFYRAVARGEWNLDRKYWRYFSPIVSVSVTSVVAVFMIDDILNDRVYWTYMIGYFAGYFSDNAVGKMQDIAVVLFSTAKEKNCDNGDKNEKKADSDNKATDN